MKFNLSNHDVQMIINLVQTEIEHTLTRGDFFQELKDLHEKMIKQLEEQLMKEEE